MSSVAPPPAARATALARITRLLQVRRTAPAPLAAGAASLSRQYAPNRSRQRWRLPRLREVRFVVVFVAGVTLISLGLNWLLG